MTRLALPRIGDPITVSTLRQALADGDRATQMWAIRNLGQLEDRDSVDLLIDRLSHPNHRVRRAAAISLAKLGDPRALAPLRRAHAKSTGLTRLKIARALSRLESRHR